MVIISGILDNSCKTTLGTTEQQLLQNHAAQCVKIFKVTDITCVSSLAQIQLCHVEDEISFLGEESERRVRKEQKNSK